MAKIIIVVGLLFAVFPAFAEEKPALDCQALEEEVRGDIKELGSCWTDSDCRNRRFGCPWESDPCIFSIVSVSEPEKNDEVLDKVVEFAVECVQPDQAFKERCDAYIEKAKQVTCMGPSLVCLNGQCVTQTHVLRQDTRPGVDKYGSRRVIPLLPEDVPSEPIEPNDSTDR